MGKFVGNMDLLKTFMRIGISLLVMILLLVVVSFLLPSKMQVEVEMTVEAPVEEVFQQVNNVKNWSKWSPWTQQYPEMTISYGNLTVGKGAYCSWTSERDGNGSLSIIESNSPMHIRTRLQFGDRRTTTNKWHFDQNGDSTTVIWSMETSVGNNPLEKYTGFLMKSRIRPDFEQGLKNMKRILTNS